jgi:hypothetical protein
MRIRKLVQRLFMTSPFSRFFSASRLFSLLWRIAILVLPWQTRWIFTQGMISGFNWEAATVSFYGSWIFLILTIVCSIMLHWEKWKKACRCSTKPQTGLFQWITHLRHSWRAETVAEKVRACFQHSFTQSVIAGLVALALVLPTLYSVAPIASMLWWLNAGVLILFFCSIRLADVPKTSLFFWFVLSLVPHAVLGIVQYFTQDAFGMTILGMAPHHPWLTGTSVVEHGLYRVLRAYGGFPHPNILGGWLAVGLTILVLLVPRQKTSVGRIFTYLVGFLFASALVFSYSRSAWLAAFVGLVASGLWIWKSLDEIGRLRILSFFVIIIASIGVCVTLNWDHVNARFHPEENRLESWSLVSRSRAMKEGLDAFSRRQVTGWGQGASLFASIVVRSSDLRTQPILVLVDPEAVHTVPLVILVEMGFFGLLAVLFLTILAYRFCSISYSFTFMDRRWTIWIPHPLLFVLVILGCADHYEWTTWAGQSLVMVSLLMAMRGRRD